MERRKKVSSRHGPKHPTFKYRKRDISVVKKRATQKGYTTTRMLKDEFEYFVPTEGDFRIRILPPSSKLPEPYYGYDIYIHYGVGVDEGNYICPKKTFNDKCPICEERDSMVSKDPDYAAKLDSKKRVAVWIIDRDKEKEGPLMWFMPWTVDRDIAQISQDKYTGEVYYIDDPEEGYDVMFSKEGSGLRTKYTGIMIARKSSPIHDDPDVMDSWLEFVEVNPINECLVVYSYDELKDIFCGASPAKQEVYEDDEDEDEEYEEEEESDLKKYVTSRRERLDVDDEEDEDEEPSPWDDEEEEEERRSISKRIRRARSR